MKNGPKAVPKQASSRKAWMASIRLRGSKGAPLSYGASAGGAGIEPAIDPVQPGRDLRRHGQIGVGPWLSGAVFQPGGRVTGRPSTRTITPRLSHAQVARVGALVYGR